MTSLTLQTIFITKKPTAIRLNLIPAHLPRSSICPSIPKQLFSCRRFSTQSPQFYAKPFASSYQEPYTTSHDADKPATEFDSFLSILEVLTLSSSVALSVYVLVRYGVQKVGSYAVNNVLIWQLVVLASGVLIGAVIRRRQWMRICGYGFGRKGIDGEVSNVLDRVEKLEDELRSTVRIVHAQSRRLEKLGIRFRVTRKSLKDPIAETAALVRKNSEATNELAAQEDILEKELGEIQKVLLAMQDQQQKQLELILAIGKLSGKNKGMKSPDRKSSSETLQPSSENLQSSSLDGVVNSAST